MQERFSSPVKESTSDAHTVPLPRTPKVIDIRLYDIPKAPYEKIGYARPVVLDRNGAWEAVLENAYDIIVTGEINGEDTLSFKINYRAGPRGARGGGPGRTIVSYHAPQNG